MCRPARGNRTRPTAAGTPEAMSFVSEMIRGQMYQKRGQYARKIIHSPRPYFRPDRPDLDRVC